LNCGSRDTPLLGGTAVGAAEARGPACAGEALAIDPHGAVGLDGPCLGVGCGAAPDLQMGPVPTGTFPVLKFLMDCDDFHPGTGRDHVFPFTIGQRLVGEATLRCSVKGIG
jgi:hypothetical protein